MAERVWAVDTITGARLGLIPVSSFQWDRKVNDAGSASCTVNVAAAKGLGVDVADFVKVHRSTLVYEVDGYVVAAGIVTDMDYDWGTKGLTVSMGDLWTVFDKRLVLNRPDTSTSEIPRSSLGATILSLQGLAKYYIDGSLNLPAGWDEYKLPVTLPDSVSGPVVSRVIYGYELRTLSDALHDLMGMGGGPDIVFLPRWAGGSGTTGPLVWDIRMADTWTYAQTLAFNLGAEVSGVKGLRRRQNGDRVVTRALVPGEGSERRLLLGNSFSGDKSYPALEGVEPSKNEKVVARLNSAAGEAVRTRSSPTVQYDLTLSKRAGVAGLIPAYQVQLGALVRLYVIDDPWLPSGWTEHRVIQISGDLASDDVKLSLQAV